MQSSSPQHCLKQHQCSCRQNVTHIQTDSAHVLVMLRRHMLGQGCIGGEGAVALGVTHNTSPGCYMLQPAVKIAGMGYTGHWGIVHKDAAAPFGVVPQLAQPAGILWPIMRLRINPLSHDHLHDTKHFLVCPHYSAVEGQYKVQSGRKC